MGHISELTEVVLRILVTVTAVTEDFIVSVTELTMVSVTEAIILRITNEGWY